MSSRPGLILPLDVAFVCALDLEAAPIVSRLKRRSVIKAHRFTMTSGMWNGIRCAVVRAPTARQALADTASAVLDAHRPPWVVAAGCAASLSERVMKGEIVVANELLDVTGQKRIPVPVPLEISPRQTCQVGPIISMPNPPRLAARRKELGNATLALVVDQQSYTLGEIFSLQATKFMVARIAVEDLGADTRPESHAVYHPSLSYRAGGLVGALLHGTGHLSAIWETRQSAQQFAQQLANFLGELVPRMGTSK